MSLGWPGEWKNVFWWVLWKLEASAALGLWVLGVEEKIFRERAWDLDLGLPRGDPCLREVDTQPAFQMPIMNEMV